MTLWLKVTKDKYELPLIVAGTIYELARLNGSTVNTIRSAMSHAKKSGRLCAYRKVEIEEE